MSPAMFLLRLLPVALPPTSNVYQLSLTSNWLRSISTLNLQAAPIAVTAAQTNTVGIQSVATAVVAAGEAPGTVIADGTSVATVTVNTDLNDVVVLPAPVPGNVVWLLSAAVAYELRSSTPASIEINGGSGAGAESAVAVTDYVTRCVCLDATHWIVTHYAADGTESAADAAV